MNVCTFTNFSFDGCVCEMLISQAYPVNTGLKSGYQKFMTYLNDGKLFKAKDGSSFDKLIMASFSPSQDAFSRLASHYKKNLSLIDHHKESMSLISINPHESKLFIDPNMSSSVQLMHMISKQRPDLVVRYEHLAKCANTFEMWNTKDPLWGDTYAYNLLFWHYGHFKFFDRYKDGVFNNQYFTEAEMKIVENLIATKNKLIESTPFEDIGNNAVLLMNADASVISDYTLHPLFADFTRFYIIFQNSADQYNVAVRSKDDQLDIGQSIRQVVKQSGARGISGGGFASSGSFQISNYEGFDQIINLIIEPMERIIGGDQQMTIHPLIDDDAPF